MSDQEETGPSGMRVGEDVSFIGAAKEFFRFSIYGADHRHIVSLQLKKAPGHTSGDLHQMQNFLWTQIGLAIREDADLQRRLSYGGIEILLDDPSPPQESPAS